MLTIATAPSRAAKRWKNGQISWADFLERLQEPTRTQETYTEYKAMTKAQQGDTKDVGGFVLGALAEGRRKKGSVSFRSGLTLDLDRLTEPIEGFWESLQMFQSYECALYSTHSHEPKNPRARLVIPLARPVSAEEYEAVARWVANDLGLSAFDPTTFEPERMMYWPSASRDGDYVCLHQKGTMLDPDTVLANYLDWRDTSFWPGLDSYHRTQIDRMKKQEDPLEKSGLIGAFCRTYTMTQVVGDLLADVYKPTAHADRWTYAEGSAVGGMVIYGDKFAYSHHATDPISGMLVNAFDMVRLHKFGSLDEDVEDKTPITSRPSYIRMSEYAVKDEAVKMRLVAETDAGIQDGLSFDESDDTWIALMDVNAKGVIQSTVNNCRLVMENHAELKGKYYFDAFQNRAVVTEDLPWQEGNARDWNDTDDAGIRQMLEKKFGITGVQKIMDGVALAFENRKVHPVRDYLSGLSWDGTERVPHLLTDYLGCENTEYTRAVITIHLVAAVARVMRPGTKYDTMLTLIGKQGIGKSTFIRVLSGDPWFNDSIDRIAGKETFELLQGSWHVELGELNATRRSEKESVKQFLSKTEDIYRAPYGRRTNRYPRQCVFWGTGNEIEFLRDDTGERRYFPVKCDEVPTAKNVFTDLEKERDQIWAEVVELYKKGTPIHLSRELEQQAAEVREQHKEDRPKVGLIMGFLDRPIPVDWYERTLPQKLEWLRGFDEDEYLFGEVETMRRDKVCVAEVWCELFEQKFGNIKPIESREIGDILRSLPDWEPGRSNMHFGEYGKQRGYTRKSDAPWKQT